MNHACVTFLMLLLQMVQLFLSSSQKNMCFSSRRWCNQLTLRFINTEGVRCRQTCVLRCSSAAVNVTLWPLHLLATSCNNNTQLVLTPRVSRWPLRSNLSLKNTENTPVMDTRPRLIWARLVLLNRQVSWKMTEPMTHVWNLWMNCCWKR